MKQCGKYLLPHNKLDNYLIQLIHNFFLQGLTYDHVELNIYLNGENLNCPIYGIKGTVYPVFYGKCYCS